MSLKERAKNQAINIVELAINFIILCLAAGKSCVDCQHNVRNQFTEAVIFGYFIVNCLVVVNIFIEDQEFHQYWKAIVAILGAVLFLVAGALILDYINDFGFGNENNAYVGTLTTAGILCLIMTIIYVVDTILIFKK